MRNVLIPKERNPGERRVAATPETVKRYVKEGLKVVVESGAGEGAFISDESFREAGAEIATDLASAWSSADVILTVGPLAGGELPPFESLKQGCLVIGLLDPHRETATIEALKKRGARALAMELIPRITRAQPMDALSSQASVAGYKAALVAANLLGRYFPLLMTAAGTIPPSRIVVMGGGVAGLQALATAKRLGGLVEVSDIRPAVKEQVESLGGRFIELPEMEGGEKTEGAGGYAREMGEDFLTKQRKIVEQHLAAANAAITTAQVPGKKAPMLISRAMVEAMKPGAVIVDLAAAQGGNCELTKPDEEITHNGVTIFGPTNLAATVPIDASTLYARNLSALLTSLLKDGELVLAEDDEVVAAALVAGEKTPSAPQAAEPVSTGADSGGTA